MKKYLLIVALITASTYVKAQVGIGVATANTSSILELSSTTKGFLPPRMLASERTGIATPATGLLVYQTDGTPGLYYNAGTPAAPSWKVVNAPIFTAVNTYTITAGTGTFNYTMPASSAGGVVVIDFNNISFGGTINMTLPSPSVAGSGSRIRLSYVRYNNASPGGTYSMTASSGSIVPSSGVTRTTTGSALSCEYVSDGTNWIELAIGSY